MILNLSKFFCDHVKCRACSVISADFREEVFPDILYNAMVLKVNIKQKMNIKSRYHLYMTIILA